MELDILEKMTRDREEREARAATKEALASKTAFVETNSSLDKGKAPMGEIPQTSVEQQIKDYFVNFRADKAEAEHNDLSIRYSRSCYISIT